MSYSPILNPHPVTISAMPSTPVTGTFWQATQPISGTVSVSGTVPVSGTFFQATQPVSAASLPLPAGAATAAKQPALGTAGTASTDVITVQGIASGVAQPVSIASMPSTPVTGTFWQATQPVSLASLPVLATGSNVIGALTANQSVNQTQVNGVAMLTGNGVTGTGSMRVTIASDQTAFSVNAIQATLTKGTQGATGISTQDLKDAGRAIVNVATAIAGVTGVTTEALLSLNVSRDGATTAAVTTVAVTSGKRYRITGLIASARSTAATVFSARVALRMNPSGAATATSTVLAIASMTQQAAALAEAGDTCVIAFPDGIEISGTMQIGLSQVCSGTGGVVYASLIGYEY